MDGKTSYQTGVRLWLASDRPAAIATFRQGTDSSDRRYQALCQGFTYFLTGRREESWLAALQEFADAELLGCSDFSMLFAVGHTAWQLADRLSVQDEAGEAVLLQLAQRCLYAVQVEMPKPMLFALERQYNLAVAHLTDQLDYRIRAVRRRSAAVDGVLDNLSRPGCNLTALACDLGMQPKTAELCLVDRLLVACAYLSRRLQAGEPADLAQVLAAN